MTVSPRPPRPIDHLVLPTSSITVARQRLVDLGFTVAPDARHPFGTENACVFFADGTYLEPLGIASREDCEASAKAGNTFTARDQAFRFRRGQEGFSSVVVATDDAVAAHEQFSAAGMSGGDMLEFSRPVRMPDGEESKASFRLAFAADLRSPDFLFFACERVNPLPADRGVLERHENGVRGIAEIVLVEPNPSDFQYLLQEVFHQRHVEAHSFGIALETANAKLSVMTPEGYSAYFGQMSPSSERGLCGCAIVLRVADLSVTEKALAAKGIAFVRKGQRILVSETAGQGALFAFEE